MKGSVRKSEGKSPKEGEGTCERKKSEQDICLGPIVCVAGFETLGISFSSMKDHVYSKTETLGMMSGCREEEKPRIFNHSKPHSTTAS